MALINFVRSRFEIIASSSEKMMISIPIPIQNEPIKTDLHCIMIRFGDIYKELREFTDSIKSENSDACYRSQFRKSLGETPLSILEIPEIPEIPTVDSSNDLSKDSSKDSSKEKYEKPACHRLYRPNRGLFVIDEHVRADFIHVGIDETTRSKMMKLTLEEKENDEKKKNEKLLVVRNKIVKNVVETLHQLYKFYESNLLKMRNHIDIDMKCIHRIFYDISCILSWFVHLVYKIDSHLKDKNMTIPPMFEISYFSGSRRGIKRFEILL